jgi:protein-L-isoaspartate(D-aspartate) O-methyltransferase
MLVAIRRRFTRLHAGRIPSLTAVLNAISKLPRHLFVPDAAREHAYEDRPLDIGFGQTISDPFVVALMTGLLGVKPGARILEIGTGSGYQAAVLAELGAKLWTIEIVEPLARQAASRLASLGCTHIQTRAGDGYVGWPDAAPFDGIIVTAGTIAPPPALLDQLAPGGKMVIPLGPNWAQEQLTLVQKDKKGRIRQKRFGQVFFVDLVRSPGP